MKKVITIYSFCVILLCTACPAAENYIFRSPVGGIQIQFNKNEILSNNITIIEGMSGILGVKLTPDGVQGGIHWQTSNRNIVEMSSFSGQEITVTGLNGGKTIIIVTARNTFNDVVVQAECTITVIPRSFFKWNFLITDWLEIPVLEARTNYYLYDAGFPVLIRTGETDIYTDIQKNGIVLDGEGAKLIIGSGMATATNSPFGDHPVYDKNGQFNFYSGPNDYSLWANRVRISIEYEKLDDNSFLRLQVNNNTSEALNASAINNWLVSELNPSSANTGTLTGIFDNTLSTLVKNTGIPGNNDAEKLQEVLSHSFICLSLLNGKVLIRNIRIESAD